VCFDRSEHIALVRRCSVATTKPLHIAYETIHEIWQATTPPLVLANGSIVDA